MEIDFLIAIVREWQILVEYLAAGIVERLISMIQAAPEWLNLFECLVARIMDFPNKSQHLDLLIRMESVAMDLLPTFIAVGI